MKNIYISIRVFMGTILLIVCFMSFNISAQEYWKNIDTTGSFPLSFDFVNDSVGSVAGANGFYAKTNDGGYNWDTISTGLTDTINTIEFVDANTGLFVTSSGFIYRTTNGGTSWDSIARYGTSLTDISFVNASVVFVGGKVVFGTKVWYSNTGGLTWNQSNYLNLGNIISIFSYDGTWVYITNVDKEIRYSLNQGASWTNLTLPTTTVTYNDIFLSSDSVIYACGTSGTIIKSMDRGASWNQLTTGTTEQLNKLSFFSNDSGFVVGANGTILVTGDGGATWVSDYTGAENFVDLSFTTDSGYALAANAPVNNGNIFKYYVVTNDTTPDTSDTTFIARTIHPQTDIVSVQPNPFTQNTKLTFTNPENESLIIKLFDLSGRVIREYEPLKGTQLVIKRNGLKHGLYFFQISGEHGIKHTGKISVINR